MTQVGPETSPEDSSTPQAGFPEKFSARRASAPRALRIFGRKRRAGTELAAIPVAPASAKIPAAFAAKPVAPKRQRKSSVLSVAVTALVVPGLFATVALPAYAFTPPAEIDGEAASLTIEEFKVSDAQTMFVASDAAGATVTRDAFTATTEAELERARLATAYASYSGPRIRDLLANPPYPSFSLDQVVAVGLQYQGVPYRYGGADPSGFDCSGFVSYVYAQFGIALPHSVSGIAAAGKPIAREAALPGDIVTMSGHNGIYMGNGNFLDAPRAGGVVSVRPIWTDDYYIVRIGI